MNPTVIQFHSHTSHSRFRFVQGRNVKHTFPCHVHNSFSLGIIQKGQRVIHTNRKAYRIGANEAFIINPYQPHSCSMEDKEGHDYWIVSINPEFLQNIFKEATGNNRIPYFPQVRIADPAIIHGFTTWLEKQPGDKTAGSDTLTPLLRELILRYAAVQISVQPDQARHENVMLACKYIEANLDHTIRLAELAAVVHMSPFYLNRVFREEIGVPPYMYLTQTRIKKSLELLLRTNSILAATHDLGFADQSHFSRFFKRNVGITPGRYLDLHRTGTR